MISYFTGKTNNLKNMEDNAFTIHQNQMSIEEIATNISDAGCQWPTHKNLLTFADHQPQPDYTKQFERSPNSMFSNTACEPKSTKRTLGRASSFLKKGREPDERLQEIEFDIQLLSNIDEVCYKNQSKNDLKYK